MQWCFELTEPTGSLIWDPREVDEVEDLILKLLSRRRLVDARELGSGGGCDTCTPSSNQITAVLVTPTHQYQHNEKGPGPSPGLSATDLPDRVFSLITDIAAAGVFE